jgi:hypothetical protein
MPGVYARIVGRLIARCPEVVAAVLDDIEAELLAQAATTITLTS